MLRLLPLALLLATLASCSSPADNSFLPDAPDARGTPLGPAGAFSATTSLAWSAATNELVGQAPSGGGNTGALVAMNAATGALRPLDADAPLTVRLSSDGTVVLWDAFDGGGDTLSLRRATLGGGGDERVTYAVGLSPHAFAIAPSGSLVAWSRQSLFDIEPESIRVVAFPVPVDPARAAPARATTAAQGTQFATVEPGTPVLVSPGGDALLYRPGAGASSYARWSAVTRTSTPYALGLPDNARGASLRWGAAGIQALYAIGARALWRRDADAGTDTPLMFTPGDSIAAQTPVWSPDGAKAALWTLEYLPIQQVTQARLYVVNTSGPVTAAVVAIGTEPPGAIAFSPDSKRVAYLFGAQARVADVPGAAAAARPAP